MFILSMKELSKEAHLFKERFDLQRKLEDTLAMKKIYEDHIEFHKEKLKSVKSKTKEWYICQNELEEYSEKLTGETEILHEIEQEIKRHPVQFKSKRGKNANI